MLLIDSHSEAFLQFSNSYGVYVKKVFEFESYWLFDVGNVKQCEKQSKSKKYMVVKVIMVFVLKKSKN